jgi:hypothetical protein
VTTRYRRTDDSLAADLGEGKLAVMGLAKGRYYALNPVARTIWDFLGESRSREEIRAHVLARFDIDAQSCERDVETFLKDLLREGLAEAVEK